MTMKIKIGHASILAIALYFGFRAFDGWLEYFGINLLMETYLFASLIILYWVIIK